MVNRHIFGDGGNVRVLDLRIVKIVEVIEDGDLMPSREQFLGKMRADETSASSHENSHVVRTSTTKYAKCTKKIIFGPSGLVSSARVWALIPCRGHEKAL